MAKIGKAVENVPSAKRATKWSAVRDALQGLAPDAWLPIACKSKAEVKTLKHTLDVMKRTLIRFTYRQVDLTVYCKLSPEGKP